jgi:hypothetical protein
LQKRESAKSKHTQLPQPLCTHLYGNLRGVKHVRNQKQVSPILHFARLAVILDKSRGVSGMQKSKTSY